MAAQVEGDDAEVLELGIGELFLPAEAALPEAMDEQDLRRLGIALCLARQHRAVA